MKIRIADINIEIFGADYSYIKERVKLYESVFEKPDLTFNCSITGKDIPVPSEKNTGRIGKWNWIIGEDNSVSIFNFNRELKKVSCLVNWNSDFNWADICVYDSCPLTGYSVENKLFNILGIVLWYSIIKYNGIVFHSSAISYNGDGVLFSAPSGTGKSTHTGLWKQKYGNKVSIVNDDTPIVRFVENKFFVYGTPWAGKTKINTPVKVPLKAIVCLEQAEENLVGKLSGRDAFLRLFNETGKPAEKNLLDSMINFVSSLANTIPVYVLRCNISQQAVDLIENMIYHSKEWSE